VAKEQNHWGRIIVEQLKSSISVEILELLSDAVLTRERVRKLTLVHWSLKVFLVGENLLVVSSWFPIYEIFSDIPKFE
jgi:capsular polysaccharide biosynthesis protein